MALVDKTTADQLEGGGEFQRAYAVRRIYEEMYDAFVEKNSHNYSDDSPRTLHNAAQQHALLMMGFVFNQER